MATILTKKKQVRRRLDTHNSPQMLEWGLGVFGCVWKLKKNSTQNEIIATKNFLSHNTENKIK